MHDVVFRYALPSFTNNKPFLGDHFTLLSILRANPNLSSYTRCLLILPLHPQIPTNIVASTIYFST